ncbi:MAG: YCF48-related protein [Candidatus Geothermincolia bacterium]
MRRKAIVTTTVIMLASAIVLVLPAHMLAESFVWSAQVSGTGVVLGTMSAGDANHVWAVGQAGTIRYTNNGGSSWGPQASGTGEDLSGISSTGTMHAWASGDHGVIIMTLNGGSSWNPQGSGVAEDLTRIRMVDDLHGWVVGWNGTIRHTEAGGAPWVGQNSHTIENLWGISAADSQNAWAVGNFGTILHTSDAGTTWSVQNSGTTNHLRDVFALDANRVWAVGDNGTLLFTTNGGQTWLSQSNTLESLRSVSAADSTHVWTVGFNRTVLFSSDCGAHWYPQSCPLTGHMDGLTVADPMHAFASSLNGGIMAGLGQAPAVTSVSPGAGSNGTLVTVNGSNFGSSQEASTVAFNGVAAPVVSWSDTQVRCTVPASATGGPVVITTPFGKSTGAGFVVRFPTWYLAEGTSAWGFTTYITIENPNSSQCTAAITYYTPSGVQSAPDVALPPQSQVTVNPEAVVANQDFSTVVTCKEKQNIAVDRTMIWTGPGALSPEGHASVGVTYPATAWYLPEGSSNWGFETWLLIQNPGATASTCTVTYMTETAGPLIVEHDIPANSRRSFSMETDIGKQDASIKVQSPAPVIAERAMYRNSRREGHDSIGTTAAATDYYLAEGTTAWGFTTYVLIQNPQSSITDVTVTYMTPAGPKVQPAIQLPANSRKTIRVNDVSDVSNTDLSTRVHGSKPIIAERSMYWNSPSGEACHDSIGMSQAHTTFYLPDGQTSDGRETWTLVQNPNGTVVNVAISYLPAGGGTPVSFAETIPANSRKSFSMTDKGVTGRASVLVTCQTSGKKIMCERAMYWNNRGAGTETIGGCSD